MKSGAFVIFSLILFGSFGPSHLHAEPGLVPPVRFEHLTLEDGLPDNTIRAVTQDQQGFLWLGTHAGLVRYDGHEMRVFLPDPADPGSMGGRIINRLLVDSQGDLWIGTMDNGVSCYSMSRGVFRNWAPASPGQSGVLPGRTVNAMAEDPDGTILVGYFETGELTRIDPETGEVANLPVPPDLNLPDTIALWVDARQRIWSSSSDGPLLLRNQEGSLVQRFGPESGLPQPALLVIEEDGQGGLLLLGRKHLSRLDPASGTTLTWRPDEGAPAREDYDFETMATGPEGSIWIPAVNGLFVFDPRQGTFTLHQPVEGQDYSLVKAPVVSICIDAAGIVWLGTWHGGLEKHNPQANRFGSLTANAAPGLPSLPITAVSAVLVDRDNRLWVGTGNLSSTGLPGGLSWLDRPAGTFRNLEIPDPRVKTVVNLVQTGPDSLWVGTNAGLWLCNPRTLSITRPSLDFSRQQLLHDTFVRSLQKDTHGHLWVGIQGHGLLRIDQATGACHLFQHDPNDPGSISQNTCPAVFEDSRRRLWVGTDFRGLNLFDRDKGTFQQFLDPRSGLVNVTDLAEGPDGQLLIGTIAGLLVMDPDSGTITRTVGRKQGLPNDLVSSILSDRKGKYWLSTGRGLVEWDPVSDKMRTFDQRDGLPGDDAFFAHHQGPDGTLYFGGKNGLILFHPNLVNRRSHFPPPVVLTDLRLFDQTLPTGPETGLPVDLAQATELTLPWNQNHLGFTFASLDFARPERNRYRFMLAGHDQGWRLPGSDRQAVYTNLAPGQYRFRVQATNSEGIWSTHEVNLAVVITPPWWRTPVSYLLYVLIIILTMAAGFRLSTRRIKRAADLKVRMAELRKLRELDRVKSRFFANISHEFRTPLTLIQGPLSRLQNEPGAGDRDVFAMMHRNARRLGQLIDQLLDLSRLESQRFPLNWQPIDGFGQLRVLGASYRSLADSKGLLFESRIPPGQALGLADADLLEKVAGNLLGNAIKYTPLGGEVWIEAEIGPEQPVDRRARGVRPDSSRHYRDLVIRVGNTGSYIPPEQREKIFERFYQMAGEIESSRAGSGIGLALTRELVDLLGGTVSLESSPETGTVFEAALPLFSSDTPAPMDLPDRPEDDASLVTLTASAMVPDPHDEEEDPEPRPLLLLVEDDTDLRSFLFNILHRDYQVVLTKDGDEGLEAAFTEVPDLIVSDVMMPGKDGFELCSAVKKDERTSHIPVILLTARAESASRIAGLKRGADSYLAKPFEPEELLAQVANLIAQRQLLRRRFAASVRKGLPDRLWQEEQVESADEAFLQKITGIAREGIGEAEFTVARFSRDVGMSRSQLHRKLTALTGMSASAFLRSVRLKRAAELLDAGYGNVTEVAYATGHKSLSHFSRIFREEHGVAPSDYPLERPGQENDPERS